LKTQKIGTSLATYKYKIFEDKKLIIEVFNGDISLDFFKQSMLKEFGDSQYKNLLIGVCDLRKANLILSDKEVKDLFSFALNHDQNLTIKWATLTNGPYETAMAMIYELQAVEHYGYKIFSTIEAASEYLGTNITEEDLRF
jgi:hypothetical protein